MEIPLEVQNKLKCSKCNALLSCGPVHMLHETGGAICGRCTQQEYPATRNGPYETTASFLAFPCVYASRGCPEKIKFTQGHPPHELTCKFRRFPCPIEPHTSCNWSGSWPLLKEHCDEKHPLNVFDNPCNPPRLDLTTSNLQTYLISAFSFLFLLRIKVCVASGNLLHSVWMFGNPKYLNKFTFTLNVNANNLMFSKTEAVASPANPLRQDPTVVCTTIDNLLRILNGYYSDSNLTITIRALFKYCLNCLNQIENDSCLKFCKKCDEKLRKCRFYKKGCLFVDLNKKKCEKHENMFCAYQTKCCKCNVDFVAGSLIEHLESSNSCQNVVKYNIDAVVRITPNDATSSGNYILFSCNTFGTIICLYKLTYSNLDVYLYTALPSHELKNFKCSMELIEPQTKHTQILTAKILDNNWRDWHISKEMHSFFSLENSGVDIKINIEKL